MRGNVEKGDRLGLLHPALDIHTMGVSSVEQLVHLCGIQTVVADRSVCGSIDDSDEGSGTRVLTDWIQGAGITVLGFSYRLDPEEGERLFSRLVERLRRNRLLASAGGPLKGLFFAGLPSACDLVLERHPFVSGVFRGDETFKESLDILGIPSRDIPSVLSAGVEYDESRMTFGRNLVRKADYLSVSPVSRSYPGFGERGDGIVARIGHGLAHGLPPLMRAHVGPYLPDRAEAVEMFMTWTRELARTGLLDVLSIGTSQLSQSAFGEDWKDLPNGGGVPLNSPRQLAAAWRAARPMLVRLYAGTKNIERLARIHEETIDIAWHALSLWWFCKVDGRGPNTVRQNLHEHMAVLRYIAASGKPFESNVPHHFAFRGADDVSYVVSGYLAARAAKEAGVRTFVLQLMLNTPKYTWGVQDLAKTRALLHLVRGLEDWTFKVYLQPRGGLDYFSPDEGKAKAQLAAVSAMMDDIEPEDPSSPQIIHVVGYSEAKQLADPAVVNESIRITRHALSEYRRMKGNGEMPDMRGNLEVLARTEALLAESGILIHAIETTIARPYSADGLYEVMASGYFPLPDLWECREEFAEAVAWRTKLLDGGVRTIDADGKPVSSSDRAAVIAIRRAHGR